MPTGLSSPSAYRVAKYLTAHPDSVITDIANALSLGRSTVTKALVALEAAGQAERRKGGRTGNRVEPDAWRTSAAPDDTVTDPPDRPVSGTDDAPIAGDTDEPDTTEPPALDEPDHADGNEPATTQAPPAGPAPQEVTGNGSKQRLRPGELREAVLAYFVEHPDLEVTAGDVARVLGRSPGAVHNVLQKLVTEGTVALTDPKPRRYKAVPPK